MASRLLAFLVLLTACGVPGPQNGQLQCGNNSTGCPDGYYCESTTHSCWRTGEAPQADLAGTSDLFTPADLSSTDLVTTDIASTDIASADLAPVDMSPQDLAVLDMPVVNCGPTGNACCSSNVCDQQAICATGTCTACGTVGQPCCSNSQCFGSACVNGQCVTCGVMGGPCCPDAQCNSGQGFCNVNTNMCTCTGCTACNVPTVEAGCCASAPKCTPLNRCTNTGCVACGARNQACCNANRCAGYFLKCDTAVDYICKCGALNQPCCNGTTCDAGTCTHGTCL